MKYTTDDYKAMYISALTIDDALNDENFTKTPDDFLKYCGFTDGFMRSISDFQDDEIVLFVRAMGRFYVDVTLPDYDSIKSTAVKMALRENIPAHTARTNDLFLKGYGAFVKGKKRKQKE